MPLLPSPLSQVCKGLRGYLSDQIKLLAPDSKVTVVLSTPSETASAAPSDGQHLLNLFFYRFEPAGLFPDSLPGETGWMRTFCLVTPFATAEDSIGPGENDLRLIGTVIQIFHDKPVFLLGVDGEDYHLQVIFQPLGLDQLNQLWSTQGDTIYRPSVLYEVSLVPVVPAVKAVAAPLTGGFSLNVQATLEKQDFASGENPPDVPAMTPDITRPDWAPAIALVDGGACALSLGFALGSPELAAFTAHVWVAGKVGESVSLRWETWDAVAGWEKVEPATAVLIADRGIDPDAAATAATTALALPFNDHVGQMQLYAERSYPRAGDGTVLTVRSNLLLISVYAG